MDSKLKIKIEKLIPDLDKLIIASLKKPMTVDKKNIIYYADRALCSLIQLKDNLK